MRNNLATLAQEADVSVDTLREIAYEHCNIPRETAVALLDLWLYERLATAAHLAGVHFSTLGDESILSMIDFSLISLKGNFIERCQASLDEVLANPVVRHEIALPEPRKFWSLPGSPEDLNYGLLEETWRGDTSSFFANLLKGSRVEDQNTPDIE